MYNDRQGTDWWRYAVVPVLLVIIAVAQRYRAWSLDQSSWIGCGFGMFATLDNHVSRFVLPKPDAAAADWMWEELEQRAKVIPTQTHLDNLAQSQTAQPASEPMRLYKISFDGESNRLSATVALESQRP